jgi:hypothetical protein
MNSALTFLATHLELGTPEITRFVISSFSDYAFDFLQAHRNVLDPELAQIKARVHLTMAHRPVGWLWTQHAPEAKRTWGQEEHAAAFVLHVLDDIYTSKSFPNDCCIDTLVYEIHRRLCVLQSLCLGNGTWVEDEHFRAQLRRALEVAVGEVELGRTASRLR